MFETQLTPAGSALTILILAISLLLALTADVMHNNEDEEDV